MDVVGGGEKDVAAIPAHAATSVKWFLYTLLFIEGKLDNGGWFLRCLDRGRR